MAGSAAGDGDGEGEVIDRPPGSSFDAESRPQRAMPLRQRKEIQKLLRPRRVRMA